MKQLDFLLAGGKEAMFKSSESSEDDESAISNEINEKINKNDIVIGISASGTTKYTVAAIKKCNDNLGALTIGISNNKNTPLIKSSIFNFFKFKYRRLFLVQQDCMLEQPKKFA